MRYTIKYILLLITVLACASCRKDKKIERRLSALEGIWNIDNYVRTKIYQNGKVEMLTSAQNVGKFRFVHWRHAPVLVDSFSYWMGEYWMHIDTTDYYEFFYWEVDAKRFTILPSTVYTIDENEKDKQVWSTYDADTTFTYKLQLTLSRCKECEMTYRPATNDSI